MHEPLSELDRRSFLQALGAGLLISVSGPQAWAAGMPVAARLFLNEDGTFTALSGKVEEGQGPRTELTQAAAEELRVPVERVRLVMADTDLVPDDGVTAGSRTTPRNVPEMRQAAATARELLTALAAREWKVEAAALEVRDGVIADPAGRTMTYADLAKARDVAATLGQDLLRPERPVAAGPDGQPIPAPLGHRRAGLHRGVLDEGDAVGLRENPVRFPERPFDGARVVDARLGPARVSAEVLEQVPVRDGPRRRLPGHGSLGRLERLPRAV